MSRLKFVIEDSEDDEDLTLSSVGGRARFANRAAIEDSEDESDGECGL
jgi:hypothetical protein